MNSDLMDNENTQEIINFINTKYEKEIPGPIKFVVKKGKENRTPRSKRLSRIL